MQPGRGEADVVFSVVAETAPGSEVRVVGSVDALGRWHPEGGVALRTEPGKYPRWSAAVRLPEGGGAGGGPGGAPGAVAYKFVKVLPDGSVAWESGPDRLLPAGACGPAEPRTPRFGAPAEALAAPDVAGRTAERGAQGAPAAAESRAQAGAEARPSARPCGAGAATAPAPPGVAPGGAMGEVHFEALCTATSPGDVLRIVGSADAFGAWQPERGLLLATTPTSFPCWSGRAELPLGASAEWKLVIARAGGGVEWETGPNRRTRPSEGTSALVRVHFGGACSGPEPRPREATSATGAGGARAAGSAQGSRASRDSLQGSREGSAREGRVEDESATSRARQQAQGSLPFRSTSLSQVPDSVALAAKGLEGSLRRKAESGTRSKRLAGAVAEHLLALRLTGLSVEEAANVPVDVVFECNSSRWRMRLDKAEAEESRWVFAIVEAGLPTGVQLFHFSVDGERVLSSDHPVFGESNAALFSEPIRRYLLTRESHTAQVHLAPLGRAATAGFDGKSQAELGTRTSSDDSEVSSQPKTCMVRPWSATFNLGEITEDEDDLPETNNSNVANFSRTVFEGLYDAELKLRIDNYVLPEAASPRGQTTLQFSLWAGAHMLKKKVGACEDAYFTDVRSLGVADGVGCMVQFASFGINAAAYAAELMEHACASLQPGGVAAAGAQDFVDARAAAAVREAEGRAEAYGAATITVLALEGNTAGVANLGDSGFMLLRKGHRGMSVVKRSEEQQHSWNCPYQLTRLPPALISRFPKVSFDTGADCEQYCFPVREGDLLLLFTDGLRDNLYEREILHIVDCALPPVFGELVGLPEVATPPENIARALALAAQERSLDPVAKVPFVDYSKRHGYQCMGGKQDDITVVAAWIMPEGGCNGDCSAPPVPAPRRTKSEFGDAAPVLAQEAQPVPDLAAVAESVALGGTAARLHTGHNRPPQLKFETPRRVGSGYEQPAHAIATSASPSAAIGGNSNANATGVAKGRPPQCRAEFRPMSSSKLQSSSNCRASAGAALRLET